MKIQSSMLLQGIKKYHFHNQVEILHKNKGMVVEVDLEEEKILDNITTQYTQNQLCKFFEEEECT